MHNQFWYMYRRCFVCNTGCAGVRFVAKCPLICSCSTFAAGCVHSHNPTSWRKPSTTVYYQCSAARSVGWWTRLYNTDRYNIDVSKLSQLSIAMKQFKIIQVHKLKFNATSDDKKIVLMYHRKRGRSSRRPAAFSNNFRTKFKCALVIVYCGKKIRLNVVIRKCC